MKAQESAENYLETILILSQSEKPVRSTDIVVRTGYSKPSVSIAMKKLRAKGYIGMASGGCITLTDSGRKIAETVYERHTLISDWLIFLGVDKKTAVNDACRMEHSMSEPSFFALKKHIEDWKREVYTQKAEG